MSIATVGSQAGGIQNTQEYQSQIKQLQKQQQIQLYEMQIRAIDVQIRQIEQKQTKATNATVQQSDDSAVSQSVSTKQLARVLGVKKVELCSAEVAEKHTGYQFGGTSPFGTRKRLPIYAEKSVFDLQTIYINGGKRGFLVQIEPKDLKRLPDVTEVEVAIDGT